MSKSLTEKIEKLQKQLDIAVEALKAIAQNSPDKNIQDIGLLCINNYYSAQAALQKIEEEQ